MRHYEEGTFVAPHGDDHRYVVLHQLPRNGDVYALGRTNGGHIATDVHSSHGVAPHAGGVHYDSCADVDGATFVGAYRCPGNLFIPVRRPLGRLLQQTGDGAVVDGHGAPLDGRLHQGQCEARIIGLRIEVQIRRRESVGAHGGHVGERLLGAKSSVQASHAPSAGEVVHPQRRPKGASNLSRNDSIAGHDRNHERQRANQMRRISQKALTLVQRLVHQRHVALLQVAKPAVDQFAALGRRSGCEVVLVDDCNAKPASGSVECHARTGDAASNHQEIECFGLQTIERVPPSRDSRAHIHRAPA